MSESGTGRDYVVVNGSLLNGNVFLMKRIKNLTKAIEIDGPFNTNE